MASKVMWLEGMVLSPHHFQQSDLQRDATLDSRFQWSSPFQYGLASLDLDREALASGFFSLRHVSGLFPDGTAFDYPSKDGSLDQRAFEEHFTAEKESLGIYLGLPALTPGAANFTGAVESGKPARYLPQNAEVADLNTGSETRQVMLGQLNLQLLFEGESTAGFQVLKLCELRRNPQGAVTWDETFIPSCLRLSAAANLHMGIKKLVDNGLQKSGALMSERSQQSSGLAQFGAEAVTRYLLLSALNRHLPALHHFLRHPVIHPEPIYRELLSFAGSLLVFGPDWRVSDFPTYAHGDLRGCYAPLLKLIDQLLAATVPTGYKIIPLAKTSPIQYLANLKDVDFAKVKQMFLGVSAQASEVEILTAVQRKAKMAPAAHLETLVSRALPGLALVPETQPPSGMPVKAGFKYFRLHQSGDMWNQVASTKSLAIHMPGDLPSTRLELLATLEN